MEHADHVALLRGAVERAGPDGALWADLGSGGGAFTLALADLLGPSGRIVSVDRDARALREQADAMARRFPTVGLRQVMADFLTDLGLPPLDGLVIANSLHFQRDRRRAVAHIRAMLRPGGRFVLVEYDADHGNAWVPYPLSFETWRSTAVQAGLTEPRLIHRVPSRFLGAIYSAVAERTAED